MLCVLREGSDEIARKSVESGRPSQLIKLRYRTSQLTSYKRDRHRRQQHWNLTVADDLPAEVMNYL